jgi:hypothetical protein
MRSIAFDLPGDEDEAVVLARLRRWQTRARALGGYVVRRTHRELVVVLPDGVEVRGGRPLTAFVARATLR